MVQNKIVQNASWMIGARIVQAILGLVISMLTARYLGPSNYGLINYSASIVTFLVPVMQLGITNVLVQELVEQKDKDGEILGTSLCLCFFSSLFCYIGAITFVFLVNRNEPDTIIVCSLYSLVIVFQSLEVTQYWFQANYLLKYSSIAAFVAYIVMASYKVFLLVTGKDIKWFAIATSIDYALIAFFLLLLYVRLGGKKLFFSWKTGKRLLCKSYYYIVSGLMVMIFAQTDKIMIKLLVGSEANGYYSAAVVTAGLSSFVFQAIIDSFRPMIFEQRKYSAISYEKYLSALYGIVIYLSVCQSIFMVILSPLIIRFLYGEAFLPSITLLQIVVWYTTFAYIGPVRNIWLLAENKQKYLWIINIFGAVINVLLNFLMIPILGAAGAAIASVITQFFTNFVTSWIIQPLRYSNELLLQGLKPKLLISVIKRM